ncbi:MAG: choice-of-anchor A family protein [Ruminiclostridium sp.]|nr:choice-of-anchor A family protein [Ruminiclostridium sp.]
MNGYEKMIRLRRMKITKIISAFTALSMTITGLAVAASADSASPDFISEALGDLTNYGIVASDMVNLVDFETNFAVKNIKLGSHFQMDNFVLNKHRTVSFEVTSEGYFEPGTSKAYYFGVYSGGELIDIEFEGTTTDKPAPIRVEFTEPGTKRFSFNIPSQYRNDLITIHKLEPIFIDNCDEGEDSRTDIGGNPKIEFVTVDEGVVLYPQTGFEKECIISDSLQVGGESFGVNKTINVGSDIYGRISSNGNEIFYEVPRMNWNKPEGSDYWVVTPDLDSEGNQIYDKGVKIANGTINFVEMPNAEAEVDRLLSIMESASSQLRGIMSNSDNVTVYSVNGSINCGSQEAGNILAEYDRVKNNPNAYLLVNVALNQGENVFVFNSGSIGTWDADESSRIIFNFYGGDVKDTHITLGDGFRGTALAPNARVSVIATMCGAIYAPQVTISSGEAHMAPYRSLNHTYEAHFYEEQQTTTSMEETTSELTSSEEVYPETTPESTPSEETTSETTQGSTPPEETTPGTTPETTVPEETTSETTQGSIPPEETTPGTTPETTVPEETTSETTQGSTPPEETTPGTTPETTVHEETTPGTTPETTVPEETTSETTQGSTPPEETTPGTTPETTAPEETTYETTQGSTPPEEITSETTPGSTSPEQTTLETMPETTVPEETIPETTPELTHSEETSSEAATEDTTRRFFIPTTTTTTVPETNPPDNTTPSLDTTTLPPEITTPVDPTDPFVFETSEAGTIVGIYSEENTSVPAPVTEPIATTTVPIVFELEEDVPRGVISPDLLPLIEIDEEVPLSDRPMNTGVDSKVGLFAAIGGVALLIGVGAQVYSVILKKKS